MYKRLRILEEFFYIEYEFRSIFDFILKIVSEFPTRLFSNFINILFLTFDFWNIYPENFILNLSILILFVCIFEKILNKIIVNIGYNMYL